MSVSLLRTGGEIADIYMRYVNTVYRVALMMLNNVPEAEDATQTAFMKLMSSDKAFENDEHLKAWLIIVTQNVCRNILKSWWRVKRVDLETTYEQQSPVCPLESETWSAVSNLDKKYRILVYLHYYEGYKTEEVARMLGINHATERTRLRTARAKLKLILEDGDYAFE